MGQALHGYGAGMGRVTTRVPRLRVDVGSGVESSRPDTVLVEEPLEVRVEGEALATTMRTPGDDFDYAIGHLLTEGLIHSAHEVAAMMHCTDVDASGVATFNVVDVTLRPGGHLRARPRARTETMTSACGVCGCQSVDDVRSALRYAAEPGRARISPAVVAGLPDTLRSAQKIFERTGGAHAAALVDTAGDLRVAREDVGRHNAVDKVIGALARDTDPPFGDLVLVVSARASFELVQKAAMVGLPALVAVGAPSSLAISLAQKVGMTLVAFARGTTFSVYAHPERLVAGPDVTQNI